MFTLQIMPPLWYSHAFHWTVCITTLALIATCYTGGIYKNETLLRWGIFSKILLFCLTLVIGLRPIHYAFGDMVNYARDFNVQQASNKADFVHALFAFDGEFIFKAIQQFCVQFADLHFMFFLFACIYFLSQYLACKALVGRYWFVPLFAMMGMIDYWGFAVNGIRNGAAANLMILALAYRNKPFVATALAITACGIHKSMLLIAGAALVTLYCKNTKLYLAGWLFCIAIALAAGRGVSEWLAASFPSETDVRMSQYVNYARNSEMMQQFSSTGFRADFLLYSALPILIGYWVIFVKKATDQVYHWWLNIYIIANSFWVLMIYAANSNRFAALSWFTAGIVLMYPFCKFKFSSRQSRSLALTLSVWYCFALFQNIVRHSLS